MSTSADRATRAAKEMLAVVLAIALAAFVAIGCGSDDSSTSDVTQTQPATSTSGAEENPVPRAGADQPAAPAGATAQTCTGTEGDIVGLRATGVNCDTGMAVATSWMGKSQCRTPGGESRYACTVDGYRCLGVSAEKGIVISCGRTGRSITFVARRG